MTRALRIIALISSTAIGVPFAQAACDVQSVTVSSGKSELMRWDVVPGEVRPVKLPNGFELGLQIEPAPEEKNRAFEKAFPDRAPAELLKIALFDLTQRQPRLITYTYGDTNSLQGYGPRGGAARAVEVGEPGILLTLKKQACPR
ncbi:hypothetical protein [Pseudoduganella sp. GCM10020061]|uniref:hypothetical protein n=1 Tax=Pseudoduganella sp. GCM10020061 TaxID=3317345 RepID=UPI003643C9A3